MVEKVWVGKKVQVLSLEELKKNYFKDRDGDFYSKNKDIRHSLETHLKEGSILIKRMQKYSGKILEVDEVFDEGFLLKGAGFWNWELWMVKEPISIQDILKAE